MTTTITVGEAVIKQEFLFPKEEEAGKKCRALETCSQDEPDEKRSKLNTNGQDDKNESNSQSRESRKESKREKRGQNKNKQRPKVPKFENDLKLCPHLHDGHQEVPCPKLPACPFMHDINEYMGRKLKTETNANIACPIFEVYGKCPRGLSCLFSPSHTTADFRNVVNEAVWSEMQSSHEHAHRQLLSKDSQVALRKHKYDFGPVERILSGGKPKTMGALTDEHSVPLRLAEMKKVDWKDKLYLSPLTTVGNLPFRRLCVDFGADITCSEMSLATSLLQGNAHEFALHRRHESEKIWGVQLCGNSAAAIARAAYVLSEEGIDYDFVDLNMGCPLDPIYQCGAGSGLMCRNNKFQSIVRSMTAVMEERKKVFTVKMRTGVKMDKNLAHTLIPFCRDSGVAMVTLHGRSREQRYLRSANWNYIGECTQHAKPMPLFGNGDVLSWEEYNEKRNLAQTAGVMIGRGALMKPWVFQEIKEQRHIDMTSSERLNLIKRYVGYGLDHWGSDAQGVSITRRFTLEWLSFFYRYIPYGVLEHPPQKINQRPPKYRGRDDIETLLASPNAEDWVKITEMFLGPVPENFNFLPKHKANAWG